MEGKIWGLGKRQRNSASGKLVLSSKIFCKCLGWIPHLKGLQLPSGAPVAQSVSLSAVLGRGLWLPS